MTHLGRDQMCAVGSGFWLTVSAAAITLLMTLFVGRAQAQTLAVLHNFTGGQDGSTPYAGVTMGGGGNLYGTTAGGAYGYGAVYRLKHNGSGSTLTPLYSFSGGSDGAYASARVTIGPDGSLYGTTSYGGEGYGVVFNLLPPAQPCKSVLCTWTETVLHTFMGRSDGAYPGYGDLLFDQAGNLYGTTTGDTGVNAGTVFKLARSSGGWTQTVLYRFTNGEEPYAGVIFDNAGNLYGTTVSGGNGNGTVYELTPSGSNWVEHMIYAFQGGSEGAAPFGGLAFDASGNLYGTTTGSGGTVYELQPSGGSWTFTLLHNFNAYLGPYSKPTLDAAGNVYGTVFGNGAGDGGRVFKLTPSGSGWTETDLVDFDGNDGFTPIGSVVVDANGNLFGTTSRGGTGCIDGCGVVWRINP